MFKQLTIFFLISNIYCYKFSPLCKKHNTSCSYQFQSNVTKDFCQQIYNKVDNFLMCQNAFDDDITQNKNRFLGEINLEPFLGDGRTIFRVIFKNIKWQRAKIYFILRDIPDQCSVKEFNINGVVMANESLVYDCPWTDSVFENRIVDFYYKYGSTKYETIRKYKFTVPRQEYFESDYQKNNLYFFTYVDYTDTSSLILKIQQIPIVTQYKVQVIYENETVLFEETLNADQTDLLEYNYNIYFKPGMYHFCVQPISSFCQYNKTCSAICTPEIYVMPKLIEICIKVAAAIFMILFIILIYLICKRLHYQKMMKQKSITVLLVTVPINNAHAIIAPALAEFLENTYNVTVLLDINEVPKTASKKSSDWLKLAITNATHIVYLRSNDQIPSSRIIYHDLYDQVIHLSHPNYIKKRKNECILSFPFSDETTAHSHCELVHVQKRFKIHENKSFGLFLKTFQTNFLLQQSFNNEFYRNLLQAVSNIQDECMNRNETRNQFYVVGNDVEVESDEDDYNYETDNLNDSNETKLIQNFDIDLDQFNLNGVEKLPNESSNEIEDNISIDFNSVTL